MKISQPALPPNSICLVDLTGFLHRLANTPGPHGMKPQLVTSKKTGEPTWGVVGTFNQLQSLAKKKPGRIIAFADHPLAGFRQELMPDYKPKKYTTFEESRNSYIGRQLDRLKQCLPYMGIPVVQAATPGIEADDLISKAAQVLSQQHPDANIVICANDTDMTQLVGGKVVHYYPYKQQMVTAENVDAFLKANFMPTKATLQASDIPVILAITGDESDGIKGIRGGMGPITLGALYEKLPSGLSNPEKIEALAKIDAELKAAAKKPVTADWKRALLQLQLTDLRTSKQAGLAMSTIPTFTPDKAAFRQVLEELTMNAFLNIYEPNPATGNPGWWAPFGDLEVKTQQPELV
jgi:5'-3' exonuclease